MTRLESIIQLLTYWYLFKLWLIYSCYDALSFLRHNTFIVNIMEGKINEKRERGNKSEEWEEWKEVILANNEETKRLPDKRKDGNSCDKAQSLEKKT